MKPMVMPARGIHQAIVELGSSAVERQTRNQRSPRSNPPLLPIRRLGIFILSIDALVDSAKYLKKGMVLYSAVSSPLDRSKRFTLSSPGRPVHSDTVLGFSWKHSSHAAIAQRLFTHISTTVYSQVLIYTAESTEASWSERKCPNFETVTTGIRTRALSIASPAFYQLSYRFHLAIDSGGNVSV